jgi:hypothetical protein
VTLLVGGVTVGPWEESDPCGRTQPAPLASGEADSGGSSTSSPAPGPPEDVVWL